MEHRGGKIEVLGYFMLDYLNIAKFCMEAINFLNINLLVLSFSIN